MAGGHQGVPATKEYIVSETHILGDLGQPDRANEDNWTEREADAEGQRLPENEQEHPRSIIQKIGNTIEDAIPGDGDKDGHQSRLEAKGENDGE